MPERLPEGAQVTYSLARPNRHSPNYTEQPANRRTVSARGPIIATHPNHLETPKAEGGVPSPRAGPASSSAATTPSPQAARAAPPGSSARISRLEPLRIRGLRVRPFPLGCLAVPPGDRCCFSAAGPHGWRSSPSALSCRRTSSLLAWKIPYRSAWRSEGRFRSISACVHGFSLSTSGICRGMSVRVSATRVSTDPATGQLVVAWPYVWGATR
jgi:hypothetical protein